jgi:hypothetical protein
MDLPNFNRDELKCLAKTQKKAIYLILAQLIIFPLVLVVIGMLAAVCFPEEILEISEKRLESIGSAIGYAVRIVFYVLYGIVGAQFARQLKKNDKTSYIILSWIPCLSGLALLIMSIQANRLFKTNGIKIGLMGAQIKDI